MPIAKDYEEAVLNYLKRFQHEKYYEIRNGRIPYELSTLAIIENTKMPASAIYRVLRNLTENNAIEKLHGNVINVRVQVNAYRLNRANLHK